MWKQCQLHRANILGVSSAWEFAITGKIESTWPAYIDLTASAGQRKK